MDHTWFRLSILGALGLTACASRASIGELGDDSSSDGSESLDLGDGDGDEPVAPEGCDDPEPIMQAGTEIPSGFVRCADGFVHRLAPVACEAPGSTGSCKFPDPEYGCTVDADCTDRPFGTCSDSYDGFACACSYGCETDLDCNEGLICACAGVVDSRSKCVPAECMTTGECGEGLCGLEAWTDVCGDKRGYLACTTDDSSCRTDAECGVACDVEQLQLRCSGMLGWTCETEDNVWCGAYCGEGRPFIVAGQNRTALPCRREDWGGRDGAWVDAEREHVSQELAAHWARVGVCEHASIASFARFGLQLLALGAPPRLLAATRRATLDEIEHARLAFALASRFAGRAIGPDAVAIAGALENAEDRRSIVRGLIDEACVGETLAAIEAHHAAEHATDPEVARALRQIAEDELRHAELGWSALQWLLEGAEASLRSFALARLDAAIEAASRMTISDHDLDLPGFGALGSTTRARVRASAIAQVLRPCGAALSRQLHCLAAGDRAFDRSPGR